MEPRLLEEAAAPAHACDDVSGDADAVRGERKVCDRRDVSEHLVAARRPGRDDRRGESCSGQLDERAGDRGGGVAREGVALCDVSRLDTRDGYLDSGRARMHRLAERAGERQRLLRELAGLLDVDEDAHATPIFCSTSTTAGAASGPWPRISASLPWLSGTTSRSFSSSRCGPRGRARVDGLALCAQLRGHGRVARQVQPFEHGHDRGQRQHVDVAAAGDLLLAAHGLALHGDALEARRDRPAERVRDADPDLEAARVRRLVAEEHEVERPVRGLVRADRIDDRCLRSPADPTPRRP